METWCSPQSHRSESGGGGSPRARAETRIPGQPCSGLRGQQVPKWPHRAGPVACCLPSPLSTEMSQEGLTATNTPVSVTLSPFGHCKDGGSWPCWWPVGVSCPLPSPRSLPHVPVFSAACAWCLHSSDSPGLLPQLLSPSHRKQPMGVFVSSASPSPMDSRLRASALNPGGSLCLTVGSPG